MEFSLSRPWRLAILFSYQNFISLLTSLWELLLFQAPSWSMFLISMCHKTFDPYSCLSTMCSKPLQYVEFTCQTYMRLSYYVGSIHVHILWEARCWNIRFFSSPFAWAALLFLFNYILDFIYLFIFSFQQKKRKKEKDEHLKIKSSWRPHIHRKIFYIILNISALDTSCVHYVVSCFFLSLSLSKRVLLGEVNSSHTKKH